MYNLAVCYENGLGVPKNQIEAEKWYRLAQEQEKKTKGNLIVINQLKKSGIYYPKSESLTMPSPLATELKSDKEETSDESLEKEISAIQISPKKPEVIEPQKSATPAPKAPKYPTTAEEMYEWGMKYYQGDGVPQDYKEAVRWWLMAAEEGDARAQYSLGICYKNGRGVEKNDKEAFRWYMLAAEQGEPRAQYNLGVCYKFGIGVPKDYNEAVKWYRLAAQQGHPQAQCNLGVCYANGEGVVKDLEEAYFWFSLAEANGNKTAAENRALLEDKLTEEQKEKIKERVQKWQLNR